MALALKDDEDDADRLAVTVGVVDTEGDTDAVTLCVLTALLVADEVNVPAAERVPVLLTLAAALIVEEPVTLVVLLTLATADAAAIEPLGLIDALLDTEYVTLPDGLAVGVPLAGSVILLLAVPVAASD